MCVWAFPQGLFQCQRVSPSPDLLNSNKQVLIGARLCIERERKGCWSVSCGWDGAWAREWGVRLLGFLVTAAWAHLIPLYSPMQPLSPCELCVKRGLSAILASAPCHSLNQAFSLPQSPSLSLLGLFFRKYVSPPLTPPSHVCHPFWPFFPFSVSLLLPLFW